MFLNKTWGAVTAVGAGAVTGAAALGGRGDRGGSAGRPRGGGGGGHRHRRPRARHRRRRRRHRGEDGGRGVKTVGEGALAAYTRGCERWLGCGHPAPEEDDLLSDMRDVLAEEGVALSTSG